MKQYIATHPKRDRRAYKKAYDIEHKEDNKSYRQINAERLKEIRADYYLKNKDKILSRVRSYSEKNKNKILEYQAKYYEANTEKVKANVSAYRSLNPEKKKYLENKRRAKKFKNGGSHTLEQRLEKFASLGNVCFYCGKPNKLTVDHQIPLSRGGTDDISNIVPCCRSCNSKKSASTTEEYFNRIKQKVA